MNCNSGFFGCGNNCWWIIILLLLCCGGNNCGMTNWSGNCGCNNNSCCESNNCGCC